MNKNPLVTVIIPAYNTEKYIGTMLDCVINQTYENLQIIVVDDGSTDTTADVVEGKSDPRIELIKKDNGGPSCARNIGIEKAKGEKIFFWDSDDIIEPDAIEKVISYAEKKQVKSVIYGYSYYKNDQKGAPFPHELKDVYRAGQIVKELIPHFIGHSFEDINHWILGENGLREGKEITALWRIMVDTQTIRNDRLLFDTRLSLGEDTKFINFYFLTEESVGFLDECLYYLRQRDNSLNMTSQGNPVIMTDNKIKLIYARKEIDEAASKRGADIHPYWRGTVVFSAVELAIKLSKNKNASSAVNKRKYYEYMKNKEVQKEIRTFKPAKGIKALPFKLLKKNYKMFYALCKIIPNRVIKKMVG